KPTIKLSGEQAEVFNEQMDTDRKLMEATDDFIAFRPAIEGEWNEGIMLGYDLPRLDCITENGVTYAGPYDWTCVVDMGRLRFGTKEPTGARMRFQCPEPNSERLREALRQDAADRVLSFLKVAGRLSAKTKRPKGFGK
ncbi:MAG: hypothetical protein ACO3TI_07555, partial [Aquiluna sp.]